MKPRWSRLSRICVVIASVGAFVVVAHMAATTLIGAERAKVMRQLTDVALRRAEAAIDDGVKTLDDIAKKGPVSCDAAALQAVRLYVYQRGGIKDIRPVGHDGDVRCSAYSETLEFDQSWVDRKEMLPARDPTLRLFRVEQFSGVALGLFRDIDAKNALVAILGVNPYVFDVMPAELRDRSSVTLGLSDGQAIARFAQGDAAHGHVDLFRQASTRYPLQAVIAVDSRTFLLWNRELYVPALSLGLILGLAFGCLLAKLMSRPTTPITELDAALAAGEFKPYLQPLFDLRSGAIVGCEALARWVRADGSVVPPSRFIPLAESSGRIEPLTWQIVSSALDGMRPHMKRDKSFKISVNIVPRHIVAPGFVTSLRRVVAAAQVSPRQIVLELTEREDIEDMGRAASVIAELHEYGFKVAIDDVGVGHNGLSHIQGLGANILKIDKFFVDSIGQDQTARAVVDMLVRLARQLGMSIIAEGIETNEQIAALIRCGVEQGQGYIVSPPLPLAGFLALLARLEGETGRADWPHARVA